MSKSETTGSKEQLWMKTSQNPLRLKGIGNNIMRESSKCMGKLRNTGKAEKKKV